MQSQLSIALIICSSTRMGFSCFSLLITLKEEYKFCTAESERSEQIKYAVDKGDFLSLSVYGDDSGKVLCWTSIERKHATTKWEDLTLNAYNPKALIMRAHVPFPSQIYIDTNFE